MLEKEGLHETSVEAERLKKSGAAVIFFRLVLIFQR